MTSVPAMNFVNVLFTHDDCLKTNKQMELYLDSIKPYSRVSFQCNNEWMVYSRILVYLQFSAHFKLSAYFKLDLLSCWYEHQVTSTLINYKENRYLSAADKRSLLNNVLVNISMRFSFSVFVLKILSVLQISKRRLENEDSSRNKIFL